MLPLLDSSTLAAMEDVVLQTVTPDETERIGADIGLRLRGSEVIELVSDLGGGKTTFTKGLVAGLGSNDHVSSPTFTISKTYTSGRLPVAHFDFYRLHEPGIVAEELAEVIGDGRSVVVVEWADIVAGVLPEQRVRIMFLATDESARTLHITVPAALRYLVEGQQWLS